MANFTLSNNADTFPNQTQNNTGDDRIDALNGNDSVDAGLGRDTIFGGQGRDSLDGGDGDDIIDIGYIPAGDFVDGGDGEDEIRINWSGVVLDNGQNTPVSIVLDFGNGSFVEQIQGFQGTTGQNLERLYFMGPGGADSIQGGAGNDTIIGNLGSDTLRGAGGDTI